MSFARKRLIAAAPVTTRGEAVVLSGDPKGNNFLYANGKSIFIRNIADPTIAKEYTQHTIQTTVAAYAPSGFYIASGDAKGKVRIWDTTQDENILKLEVDVIGGKIKDIAWDADSKRIIAVGDGRESYGRAFMFDSGNSVGEISGHFKVLNSVSIRGVRPYRAATGGDDNVVVFYEGPPFKSKKSLTDHTGFVQSVKFSPDGERLVTVASDKKVFLYDGKTGDKITDLSEAAGSDAHKGGIYAVGWSGDSKKFVTSSGDRTVKLWDVSAQKVVRTYTFPDAVENQQLGNLWQGAYILSLSLSGDINYLDENSPTPVRVIKGHQKAITAITIDENKTVFTASYDGKVLSWSGDEGNASEIAGKGHTNQVLQMAFADKKVFSVGMDDSLRELDVESKSYSEHVMKTEALPKAVAASNDGTVVVATIEEIQVIKGNNKVASIKVPTTAGVVAVKPSGDEVAFGGQDKKIRLYSLKDGKLEHLAELAANPAPITYLAYSPSGSLLAAADSNGKIRVHDTAAREVKARWDLHTARVDAVAWSPDGKHAASGSLDTNVYVWSVDDPSKSVVIKGAHQVSVTGVIWLNNSTIVSVGKDACLKTWEITHA